jgi:purine-binding chemotaxis protein CheW
MTTPPAASAAKSQDPATQQVLTFELGTETYGVEILRVREIRGWTSVTRIPHAPAHVLGVLNLRGSIVPVLDLRMRFELERAEYTKVTVIIVLSVHSPAGRREVGVVVDAVSDVIAVNFADVKEAPDLGLSASTEYIRGLIPVANRMVVLLDIDRLVGRQFSNLPGAAEAAAELVAAA